LNICICYNISTTPLCGIQISQLIQYSWARGSYYDLLDRGLLLAMKQLLNQLFLVVKMKSSLGKFYGHHHHLVNSYGIAVLQMPTNMLCLLFMTIVEFVGKVTQWVPHIEQELLTLAELQCSPLVLCRVPIARSFVFCIISLFVLFLLVIALSFLPRFTGSGYPFGIFNHFLRLYSFW